MVKFILIKFPDEWATTKQGCRDELVVYLFFSSTYTSLYFYVLSTVLRKSSFILNTDKYYPLDSPDFAISYPLDRDLSCDIHRLKDWGLIRGKFERFFNFSVVNGIKKINGWKLNSQGKPI